MDVKTIRSKNHSPRRLPAAFFLYVLVALSATIVAPSASAQESIIQIDPAQTKIDFSLGSTLHTVHGTFVLKSNTIRFDTASGRMSGRIIVDATSGESGNSGRDSRMHREILESVKFPEIVFTPERIKGAVAADGTSKVEVSGRFGLHGMEHDVTLPVEVVAKGQEIQLSIHYAIPYVDWGLKNPSNFLLRASSTVEIEIHASGRMEKAGWQ